jgi:protein involved in polysaccharide export with SLBB domain
MLFNLVLLLNGYGFSSHLNVFSLNKTRIFVMNLKISSLMRNNIALWILVLGCVFSSYTQQLPAGMNPTQARQMAQQASKGQLMGYVQQSKLAGYSLNEVKSRLRAQGASMADIKQLEDLWNAPTNQLLGSTTQSEKFQSNFGINTLQPNQQQEKSEEDDSLFTVKRFGSDFFKAQQQQATETAPQLYVATPSDYQLGPGDELLISLYGASEESYIVQLTREGTIKVERLAPIYLSGLSIADAKKRLINRFSEIYTGLKAADNDQSKVSLSLSLQNARSIVVNITGQVVNPGTYTLSAFTSVINALYSAGGPNQVGSYRAVRLIRAGKLIKEIDLYEFFAGSKLAALYLQDQDVLQVPAFKAQVELKGAFKSPGFYELKKDETLSDVLKYSGGFLSDGYKDRVFVSRIMNFKRQSVTLATAEAGMHLLKDGDVVEASFVQNVLENAVQLEGAVYIPGTYSLTSVGTIKEALEAAGGLTREALKGQATLFRSANGVERAALSVDLNDELQLNYALKEGDRLFVPQDSELFDAGVVRVEGEVNNPGVFEYKHGMGLSDALILAQGFKANANKSAVSVYQNFLMDGEIYTQTEIVEVNDNLNSVDQVILSENALIVVRRHPSFREVEEVYLSGLVHNEGSYAIKGNNYRLYNLLEDSGGFLKDAYLKGISIKRALADQESNDSEIVQTTLLEALEASSEKEAEDADVEKQKDEVAKQIQTESVIIGIDGERLMASGGTDLRENIVLQNGDSINVPKLDNTITILGEIQKKSKVVYTKNITVKKAVRFSGGYNDTARRARVYVIYKNGTIKSRRHFLGLFTSDPQLEPGATVVVPERLVREGSGPSLGEIVGLSSSLATLVLLLQQLGL